MTTDDILKLIMAGTGSAAALYTISHPQQTQGRVVTVGTSGAGTTVGSASLLPLLLVGGLLLFVLAEK